MQPEEGTNETVHRSFLPTINETLAEFKGNETLLALYKNITRMIEIFRQKELEASEVKQIMQEYNELENEN